MKKRQLFINAIMSVSQVTVAGGVLFILYRFLLNTIGVEQLGIWSVVLATTSMASIANLGLSASVVKFVAKYVARGEEDTVVSVIQTSVISIGILFGLVLLIAYPFAKWLLNLVVPPTSLKEAISILPYALLSLWIMVISSIFQSALDGYQRIDLRCLILMAASVIHLFLSFVLVPSYGLVGLAYAQVAQSCLVFIGSYLMLRQYFVLLPIIPHQWDRKLFSEMIGYGLNFQVISISQMLYDPITKALLTKFGGLSMTGFYEMASRMILQVRALLVTANQVLVPTIADLQERKPELIESVYKSSYHLLFYLALPLFLIIVAFTPIISELWIGRYESLFVLFAILLAIGWFLNVVNAPAYFANLGVGELKWNTISHIIIGLLSGGLGLLLGSLYGGKGVVVGWVISLITGSNIITVSYHLRHKIPIRELLTREDIGIGLVGVVGLSICLLLYYRMNSKLTLLGMSALSSVIFSSIVIVPFLRHPMRRRLTEWVTNELLNR